MDFRRVACLLLLVLLPPLAGQSIEVRHPPEMGALADQVRAIYADLLGRTTRKLRIEYDLPLVVEIARDHEDFQAILRREGAPPRPPQVAAIAFPWRDLIVLRASSWTRDRPGSFADTFQHEIAHCVIGAAERRSGVTIPVWLNEGVAQWVTESLFLGEDETLSEAIRNDRLIPFSELVRDFPDAEGASALAYAQSLSLVRHLDASGGGEDAGGNVVLLLRAILAGRSAEEAIRAVTGLSGAEFEAAWREKARSPLGGIHAFMEFIWSGFLLLALGIAFATHRVQRRRRLEAMAKEEEQAAAPSKPWSELFPPESDDEPGKGGARLS